MNFQKIISKSKHTHGADLSTKRKASELRKSMTSTEKKLWEHLRLRRLSGMHFRRQHPFGFYILDFFCTKANLAIELDGEIHKFKKKYDYERTRYLEDSVLKILRFTNKEIEENIEEVKLKIRSHLEFS